MKWLHRLQFVLTGDCGYACGMDRQFGFVPEADCPVHDNWPMKTLASLDLIHGTKEDVKKYQEAINQPKAD